MLEHLDDGLCTCCGQPTDHCICPECSVCGAFGDPNCYQPYTIDNQTRKCSFTVKEPKGTAAVPPMEFNRDQLAGQVLIKILKQIESLKDDVAYINAIKNNQTDDTDKEIIKILNSMLFRLSR